MANQISPMRGVLETIQNAQTSGNGTILAIPNSFRRHSLYIKGSVGSPISAGAVQPESSSDPTYTGTWGQIGGGPVTVVDSTEIVINFEGVYQFIRCGISTPIVGGTVTVNYLGQP